MGVTHQLRVLTPTRQAGELWKGGGVAVGDHGHLLGAAASAQEGDSARPRPAAQHFHLITTCPQKGKKTTYLKMFSSIYFPNTQKP